MQEKQTGVTWHRINNIIDGGNILGQKVIILDQKVTSIQLIKKQHMLSFELFNELLPFIFDGVPGEKQKEDWLSGKGLSITKKSDFKEFESTTYDQSDKENYHTNGEVKIPTKIEIDETKEECEEGRKKVRLTAELDLSVNEDDGLYWYITAIEVALKVVENGGRTVCPIRVFTDGYPDEVAFITKAFPDRNVIVMEKAPAIQDVLTMSRAQILVCTADSTFSMWAVFLGQMPSVWRKGSNMPKIYVDTNRNILV